MFSFFSKSSASTSNAGPKAGPMKGYKVSLNSDRSRKYGVAANSLIMLRTKIAQKFNLKDFNLFLSDGSAIDTDEDFFLSIPQQSLIIVAHEGEDVKTGKRYVICLIYFHLNS